MAGRIPDAVKHRFQEILESPSGFAKFKRVMAATKKEEAYLQYFKECMDRKYGKAPQFLDMDVNDVTDRPTSETLLNTITALRAELDSLRTGTSVETK